MCRQEEHMIIRKRVWPMHAVLAAALLAAVPAVAVAQGQTTQPQGQQQQGQQQQGQQQAQPGQQEGKITKKMTLKESMSLPLPNGCTYMANVNGTITPRGAQQQQRVDPNLKITAAVSCPGQVTIKAAENVSPTGGHSPEALEEALERRGTLFVVDQGRQCAFAPDFELTQEGLKGVGVAYLCAIAAPSEQRGGG
jgi:hypothetical protein